jgi:hypothetical protein
MAKDIELNLSPLQASAFMPLLRMLADSIEAQATSEGRVINVLEDLQIDVCADLHSQIIAQSHIMDDTEVTKEMEDYKEQYLEEQEYKAKNN